jgi:hypothetical protein
MTRVYRGRQHWICLPLERRGTGASGAGLPVAPRLRWRRDGTNRRGSPSRPPASRDRPALAWVPAQVPVRPRLSYLKGTTDEPEQGDGSDPQTLRGLLDMKPSAPFTLLALSVK